MLILHRQAYEESVHLYTITRA